MCHFLDCKEVGLTLICIKITFWFSSRIVATFGAGESAGMSHEAYGVSEISGGEQDVLPYLVLSWPSACNLGVVKTQDNNFSLRRSQ